MDNRFFGRTAIMHSLPSIISRPVLANNATCLLTYRRPSGPHLDLFVLIFPLIDSDMPTAFRTMLAEVDRTLLSPYHRSLPPRVEHDP